jgi:hypothetical protein
MLTMKQKMRRRICYGLEHNGEKSIKIQCDICDIESSPEIHSLISFQSHDEIIFVPTLQEYQACGIHQELWWQLNEMNEFMSDATREVLEVMKNQDLDVKSAKRYLYEPLSLQKTRTLTEDTVTISFSADTGDNSNLRPHGVTETLIFHRDIEFLPLTRSTILCQSKKLASSLSSSSLPSVSTGMPSSH